MLSCLQWPRQTATAAARQPREQPSGDRQRQGLTLQKASVQKCLLPYLKVLLLQPVSVMRLGLRHQALLRAAAGIPLQAGAMRHQSHTASQVKWQSSIDTLRTCGKEADVLTAAGHCCHACWCFVLQQAQH